MSFFRHKTTYLIEQGPLRSSPKDKVLQSSRKSVKQPKICVTAAAADSLHVKMHLSIFLACFTIISSHLGWGNKMVRLVAHFNCRRLLQI